MLLQSITYTPPAMLLSVHRVEEIGVLLGLPKLIQEKLDRIDRAHRVQDAAEHIHLLEDIWRNQKLFLAGAGAGDVDRREDALVRDLAVQDDLGIAGTLE